MTSCHHHFLIAIAKEALLLKDPVHEYCMHIKYRWFLSCLVNWEIGIFNVSYECPIAEGLVFLSNWSKVKEYFVLKYSGAYLQHCSYECLCYKTQTR